MKCKRCGRAVSKESNICPFCEGTEFYNTDSQADKGSSDSTSLPKLQWAGCLGFIGVIIIFIIVAVSCRSSLDRTKKPTPKPQKPSSTSFITSPETFYPGV
ncbi:putative membrane protein YvbJ [Paenibacillus shirakamiensis]|uniref:Membrane protein YvbJ n=1 Tax=Paenibacillus shirakamiensis TaxID=1265935 RepID=A0ABS4JD43_9BACL|nr:hypothetical protein [Paenibacillus shirakamiensis]MBP1999638.1 putative membrane protein YvbJ [Paenibacillus shirakamiensis]